MEILLATTSIALLVVLIWDVFITVFSGKGAGPLSNLWYRLAWQGLLALHEQWPMHRLLSLAGPFMLLASFLLWYVMLAVALFLALATTPGSIVNNTTGEPADLLELVYFVGTTVSSLGYGDLIPSEFPWTLASTISTLGGAIIITVSLSYVLAVLAASIERRKLAQGIFGLGETAPEMIDNAALHDPEQSLKSYVLNLSSEIDHQALKLLSYPILKYFHSPRADLSPGRAVLHLSDALFLLSVPPEGKRPPSGVLHVVDHSIARYVELSRAGPAGTAGQPPRLAHLRESARQSGVLSQSQEEFDIALEKYGPFAICVGLTGVSGLA